MPWQKMNIMTNVDSPTRERSSARDKILLNKRPMLKIGVLTLGALCGMIGQAHADPLIGASSGSVAAPLSSPLSSDASNCNAGDINTVSFALVAELDVCTSPSDSGRSTVRITYTANTTRYV